MEKSQPVEWLGGAFEGFVVNAEFTPENKKKIMEVISRLSDGLGDSIFTMPENSLHITLLDWIAPLVDYEGQDKTELFKQIEPTYDEAIAETISGEGAISVKFDRLRVSPTTIFITGSDNGGMQRIRDAFIDRVTLLPDTKKPPQIIHSSLARFTQPVKLAKVHEITDGLNIDITQVINEFRLVHTMREPMLDFEVIKTYHTT